jgi:hypothetical protein
MFAWMAAVSTAESDTRLVHDAPGGGIVVRPWGERSFYGVDP